MATINYNRDRQLINTFPCVFAQKKLLEFIRRWSPLNFQVGRTQFVSNAHGFVDNLNFQEHSSFLESLWHFDLRGQMQRKFGCIDILSPPSLSSVVKIVGTMPAHAKTLIQSGL